MAVHFLVEQLRFAGFRIDPLDGAEFVVRVRPKAHGVAFDVAATAVVAEIEVAVGADC